MLTAATSLRRLAQVRDAAEGVRSAYLLRTRLHRLLLSLQRSVASELDLVVLKPCHLEVNEEADPDVRAIIELCNVILRESAHLSQRSEALDERWESAWVGLRERLALLEAIIVSATGSTTPSSNVSLGTCT